MLATEGQARNWIKFMGFAVNCLFFYFNVLRLVTYGSIIVQIKYQFSSSEKKDLIATKLIQGLVITVSFKQNMSEVKFRLDKFWFRRCI